MDERREDDAGTLVGRRIGRYRIEERIGGSPLGPIYRAHDERLARRVAIQVLSGATLARPETRALFRKRVQALAALDHPHIGRLFDFAENEGLAFVVMEHIEGRPLSERIREAPLSVAEVARIGAAIADAIGAAHEAGVTHQTLSSDRVRILDDGDVKVLGFESTHLAPRPASDQSKLRKRSEVETETLSEWDRAPDEAGAPSRDPHNDVHAIGALLSEMLSPAADPGGEGPGASAAAGPAPHQTSGMLTSVIRKALAEKPENRYQSAAELKAALAEVEASGRAAPPAKGGRRRRIAWLLVAIAAAGVAAAGTWYALRDRGIRAIAVLEIGAGGGGRRVVRALGDLTDRLARRLARLPGLEVIGRASGRPLRGQPLGRIGAGLGVDAIVTGRIQIRGGRSLLGMELVASSDQRLLWGARYDLDLADIEGLALNIARELGRRLRPKHPEPSRRPDPEDVPDDEARRLYLKAIQLLRQPKQGEVARALRYLRQATTRQPRFASAFVAVGIAYNELAFVRPPREMARRATGAARTALEIRPQMGEALAVLAMARDVLGRRWTRADRLLREAVARAPSNASGYLYRGILLCAQGRLARARKVLKRARDLDPFSLRIATTAVWPDFFGRRYDAALLATRRLIVMQPEAAEGHTLLGWVLAASRRFGEALAALRKAAELSPGSASAQSGIAAVLAMSGGAAQARKLLSRVTALARGSGRGYYLGIVHAHLGDRDRAFSHLERALEARSPEIILAAVDPRLDPLRSDPRFPVLLRRLGLPSPRAP